MKETSREEFYSRLTAYAEKLLPDYDRYAHEAVLEVVQLYSSLEAAISRELQVNEVSSSAFNLLVILDQQENQCLPLHEIGRLMVTSRPNIPGLVENLEKRGLVDRIADPQDGRGKLARLLPAGKSLLHTVLPRHSQLIRRICSPLSPAERKQLFGLARKWRSALCSFLG